VKIKICGLMETATLATATAAGADFLGMVLAPSTRRVTPAHARRLVNCARAIKSQSKMVGVFVNAAAAEVNRLADFCCLDYVQLSGDEDQAYCRQIERPLIKAIHISSQTTEKIVMQEIENNLALKLPNFIIVLDTGVGQLYGGTGKTFDWQLAREVAGHYPVIVAGGLNPSNVGELVRQVHPWGVDVSSGVETHGSKDEVKIRDFIEQARGANSKVPNKHQTLPTTPGTE
jgi:phosphoribosylanthranilate isomerase